ncbi:MAG: peptidylprolyl isomerase, partial [Lachnospiraceae bacterium]|nr:peptidylprolyl isomerase [Lachnospiraceae bacterium]
SPHLDGAYAAFGKTIEGMAVVDRIAQTRVDWNDRPLEKQVMETVTVEVDE